MCARALFLFTALGLSTLGRANNIAVSNVSLTGQNTTAGANNAANFALVQFDLSWQNSWRVGYSTGVNNWDAAWVFVKYRVNGGDWAHAYLNDSGHDDGSGTTLDIEAGLLTPGSTFNATTNPALGCFFYRNAAGTGNISNTALQLRWNYGANGLNDNDLVEVKVFAIEMAYVPQGGFDVGINFPVNPLLNDTSARSVTFQLTGNGVNNGTSFNDQSTAGNSITRTNNPVYSTTQACFGGSSVYFDGTNDNLQIGAVNDADFNFGSGDFTIELYVRPDGTGSEAPISYVGGPIGTAEGWSIHTSTQLHFYTYNNSGNPTVNLSGGTITANTWHHIAITRSGTTITGYVNGAQAFTTTLNGNLHTMGNQAKYLQLGERYYGSGTSDYGGYISHVRITKGVARPASEFLHPIQGHLLSATQTASAHRIGNESALTLGGSTAGNLISNTVKQSTVDDFNSNTTKSLGANFPKGHRAFYCMKSEISQQQYVNFLNTLTRAQQDARTATSLASGTTSVTNRYVMSNTSTLSNRNGIRCDASIHTSNPITFYCDFNGNGTGGESGDGLGIACNFLSWADGAAYMDWAGLRPMTELEFEKAARGPNGTLNNEYAWGSTSATPAATLNNSGANNEAVSTGNAIYGTSAIGGPLRTGAFAQSGTGRAAAGGSLYGILDLSGNLEERAVCLGSDSGRVFTGVHGNGALAATGNADASNWPTFTGNGGGFRGGAWNTVLALLRTSDRMRANVVDATRAAGYGFRGVRSIHCTAPTSSTTISGTAIFNTSSPNQTYNGSGATDYLWSISSNLTLNSGQGTSSIAISAPNSLAAGIIYCSDVNACGSGPETQLAIYGVSKGTLLASGGTISTFVGDGTNGTNGSTYFVHTFNTVGSHIFNPFVNLTSVEYLVVAGGGGGGNNNSGSCYVGSGGGGAGGYRSSVPGESSGGGASAEATLNLIPRAIAVAVGAGGASAANGSNSSFESIISLGGGTEYSSGGSGGGGSGNGPPIDAGGSGTANQGYSGGSSNPNTYSCYAQTFAGAGGGGAGGTGVSSNSGSAGGDGGAGLSSRITGSAVTRAGGGGGGRSASASASGDGAAGGGNGGNDSAGTAASANSGSGGGGASVIAGGTFNGGAGGSGVVIVRYVHPNP